MRKTKRPKRNARDMVSVGIDLGEATSHVTIFANEKAETFEFPMDPVGYSTLKERVPVDARIVSTQLHGPPGSGFLLDR